MSLKSQVAFGLNGAYTRYMATRKRKTTKAKSKTKPLNASKARVYRAVELRLEGQTIEQIASTMKWSYSYARQVINARMTELAEEREDKIDEMRSEIAERNMRIIRSLMPYACPPPVCSECYPPRSFAVWVPECDKCGSKVVTSKPCTKAVEQIRKIQAEHSKLFGLYSPEKLEVNLGDTKVSTFDPAQLSDEELELAEQIASKARRPGADT